MKTNFALNFTDTSIALLHRTAKGWLKVGETPFDTPDLPEAMDYLRKTALGLEPGGFTTKLVIPASQVLYAEMAAGSADGDARRKEVIRFLEDKTPLKADEIAFDTSISGAVCKIAAVARDTLDEAEAFATEHKFNPVGFVSIPEPGQFEGEPWYGETAIASELLPAGETVARDSAPIILAEETGRRGKKARSTAPPATEPAADAVKSAPPETKAADTGITASPDASGAKASAETTLNTETAAPKAPTPEAKPAEPAPAPEVKSARETASTPTVSTPDAPKPVSAAPSESAAKAPIAPVTSGVAQPLPAASAAAPAIAAPSTTAPAPVSAQVAPVTAPLTQAAAPAPAAKSQPTPQADALPAEDIEEAPFAEVPEANLFPEESLDLDIPPMPALAASRGASAKAAPPLSTADDDADLPPLPSAAILEAYKRSRSQPEQPEGGSGSAARPSSADLAKRIHRPLQGDAAATGDTSTAPVASKSSRLSTAKPSGKSLAGLVTAPSIPGTRKTRVKTAAAAEANAVPSRTIDEAARSLGKSSFAKSAQPGRPRHLALILIAALLLCLALVAAWASLYLSSVEEPQTTAIASSEEAQGLSGGAPAADPAVAEGLVEDEALADGIEDAAPDTELNAVAEAAAASGNGLNAAQPSATAEADPAQGSGPAQEAGTDIQLSAADTPPQALESAALPAPANGADTAPESPMPPMPFGTVYRYDADGLLEPSPTGIPSPDGYTIYSGKPSRIPPPRSAAAEAAALAAQEAAPAQSAPAADAEAPATQNPETAAASLLETAPPATGADSLPAVDPAAQPNPELADRRPRLRPNDTPAPVVGDDAALTPETPPTETVANTGPRPRAKPESILAAAEAARTETAAASLANDSNAAAAGTEAPAEEATLSIAEASNPSLLTISRRPAAKPKDFSRAVEAAVAAAIRTPDPEPEPVLVAAVAPPPPKPAAAAQSSKPAATPEPEAAASSFSKSKTKTKTPEPRVEEDDDEPEVASVSPRIPTKANVAKQATYRKAINLSKINLIGVYGTKSNRTAMVRLANGKFRKVSVGDKIDGGQVKAITQNEVRYQKGGRLISLAMPKS